MPLEDQEFSKLLSNIESEDDEFGGDMAGAMKSFESWFYEATREELHTMMDEMADSIAREYGVDSEELLSHFIQ